MRFLNYLSISALRFLALGILIVGLAAPALPQGVETGAINGTVTDPSGLVVPGAQIVIRSTATGLERRVSSSEAGVYSAPFLRPGRYEVVVSAAGFAEYRRGNVVVEVGRVSMVDVPLSLAAQVSEVVVAVEATPIIVTDRQDISTTINNFDIQNLPISGRRWSNLVLTTPGTAPDGPFGLISFRGISGLLNNNMVDGGANNQAFFAEEKGRTRIAYSTSQAFIQEYQVNTSNFSAEFGRSAGGVVNAVTRSGASQFHMDGFWFYRSSDFGAFNPFAFFTPPPPAPPTPIPVKPTDKRHQFGGTLGGPIIRDRLFFFFGADQQKRNFPGIANAASPTAFFAPLSAAELSSLATGGITPAQAQAGLSFLHSLTGTVPRTGDQLLLFPKLDIQANPRHHITLSYNRMRWTSPAGIQTGGIVFRGKESFGSDFVKTDTVIAKLSSSISPTLFNEFRFNFGRDFEFQTSQPSLPGQPVSQQGVSPQIGITTPAFTFGKPNFLDRRAFPDEKNYQFTNTTSWTHGAHLLKFGLDINRVSDRQDNLFQESGVYSYSTRVLFIADYAAAVNSFAQPVCSASGVISAAGGFGCYTTFDQGFGPTVFRFRTIDYGLFVQDTWRVTPRVTLNLGMRWDYQQFPRPQFPNAALPESGSFPSDQNNFGPRLGIAFDLTGQQKMVLRGGYGIYYGRIINSTILNSITLTGASGGQSSFRRTRDQSGAPRYPNVLTSGPAGAGGGNVIVFPSGTALPQIHQVDAVFEYSVARNTAVSVAYLGSVGRKLPRFIDRNLPPPTVGATTFTIVGGADDGKSVILPKYVGSRPNPNFLAITNVSYSVKSRYNAMVVKFERRMLNGFQMQASYTFSKATDDGQGSVTFTSTNNVLDPFNLAMEEGRSNFDVPHRFVGSAVWQPPYFTGREGVVKYLLDGWSFSPIVTISSGSTYSAGVSGNAPGSGISSGILRAGGSNRMPTIPRNAFRTDRIEVVDLRIAKRFPITERLHIDIFGESFNLFNHVNISSVNTTLYTISASNLNFNPLFGQGTGAANFFYTPRQIQIGAKFAF